MVFAYAAGCIHPNPDTGADGDTSGAAPSDTDEPPPGWESWLASVASDVAATGTCPSSTLPVPVTMDGQQDETGVVTFDGSPHTELSVINGFLDSDGAGGWTEATWLRLLSVTGDVAPICPDDPWYAERDYDDELHSGDEEWRDPSGDTAPLLMSADVLAADWPTLPGMLSFGPAPGLTTGGMAVHGVAGDLGSLSGTGDDGLSRGYGFLCIESLGAIPDPAFPGDCPAMQAASFRGSAFIHFEGWTVDAHEQPDHGSHNYFYPFDHVDCLTGECPCRYDELDQLQCRGQCDGLDNDLDGKVDEGALDADGDGIADCAAK
jgi:hypothetical protein